MVGLQRAIAYAGTAVLISLIAGLFVRRRHRSCAAFTLYALGVLLSDVLIMSWPGRFNTWDFWLAKETAHTALKLAVALEIAAKTFRLFPGARATGRVVVLFILVFTLGASLAVPSHVTTYGVIAGRLLPRVLNGTAWLFVGIAAVILWYRLPVDVFNKAIVMGFAPYLLVFAVAMNAANVYDFKATALSGNIHSASYVAVEVYWALAAWRKPVRLGPRRGGRGHSDNDGPAGAC